MTFLNLCDDRVVLLTAGLVDPVVAVRASDAPVGRNHDDIQFVDVVELIGFGLGRARHSTELLVQAEVVLDRDRRQGLGFTVDLHALFGLNGLVQSVAPTPTGHLSPGVLVDDDHLVVFDNVLHVLFE